MKRVYRKLHTQQGASLLVALVFFLVCAMVAAVILGSATTNTLKVQQRREEKQIYNSVSSAAKFLRDTMNTVSMEGSEIATHYGCNDYASDQYHVLIGMSPEQEADAAVTTSVTTKQSGETVENDALIELLQQGVQKVYQSKLELASDKKIAFDGWNESFVIDDGLCQVAVQVSIKNDYTLTFRLAPSDAAQQEFYNMTLTCEGRSTVETQSDVPTCTHMVTLQDLFSGGQTTTQSNFTGIRRINVTVISWENGIIYKGGSSNG